MTPTPLRSACKNCGHPQYLHLSGGEGICDQYVKQGIHCPCPSFTPSPHSEQAAGSEVDKWNERPGGLEEQTDKAAGRGEYMHMACVYQTKCPHLPAPTPKPISEWEEEFYRAFWYVNNNNLHERHGEGCGCRLGLARDIKAFITRTIEAAGREKEHKHGINTGNRYCDVCRGKLICNPHDPLIQCGVHCQYRPLKKEEENPDRELEGIDELVKEFDRELDGLYRSTFFNVSKTEVAGIVRKKALNFIRTQFPKFAAKEVEAAIMQKVRDAYYHGYTNGVHSPNALTPRGEEIKARGYAEGAEAMKRVVVKAIWVVISAPRFTKDDIIKAINDLPLPTDTTKDSL